jgi:hypothetical protein
MTKKKQTTKQRNPQIVLTISLYTMAAWVGVIMLGALISLELLLLVYTIPYLPLIYWGWSTLRGQIKSETLQQLAIFFCILGALSVLAMIWIAIAFQLYFQW